MDGGVVVVDCYCHLGFCTVRYGGRFDQAGKSRSLQKLLMPRFSTFEKRFFARREVR